MQGDGDFEVRVVLGVGSGRSGIRSFREVGVRELEESNAAPLGDNPVWGLQVGGACVSENVAQVVGRKEEGIGELVLVEEEG